MGFRGLGTEIQRQTQGCLVIPSDRWLSFWHVCAVRFLHCLKSPPTPFSTSTLTSSVKFCSFLKPQLKHCLLGNWLDTSVIAFV